MKTKPAQSEPTAPSPAPHNFVHTGKEVLILRRTGHDRKSHGGFTYPAGVGSTVAAPDFNSRPECGGGLHGWPWGFGLGEGQDYALDDLWIILGAKPEDVVGALQSGWKCKCKEAVIRYEGDMKGALDMLRDGFTACVREMTALPATVAAATAGATVADGYASQLAASGDDSQLAASGNASKLAASGNASKLAASGDDSQLAASGNASKLAASGDASQLAASGYASQLAASGYASKLAASGDDSQLAASGDASQLAASGDASQLAASGYASKLAASGDASQLAASGNASKLAASGDASQLAASGYASQLAASGYASKLAASGNASQLAASGNASQLAASGNASKLAASGNDSCAAVAAHRGRVKVGKRGAFAVAYWQGDSSDSGGWRFVTGKVGENGVKADTWYEVRDGQLVEAS